MAAALSLSLALMVTWAAAAAAQGPTPAPPAPPVQAGTLPPGLIPEAAVVKTALTVADRTLFTGRGRRDGFYIELGNMITGSGWISAGPGYRHHIFTERAVVDASVAVSRNLYTVAQARLEAPHFAHDRLLVGAQALFQDQRKVDYFGRGPESAQGNRSQYRFKDVDVFGYARIRATSWLSMDGLVGRMDPTEGSPVPAPFVHGDVSVAADFRDETDHPTCGGLYLASAASYSDRVSGAGDLWRYDVEASQF